MIKVAAFSVALLGYVFLIGWMITWVRLSAARLPVDASLPVVDDKVVFTIGLRTVLLMAAVFATICPPWRPAWPARSQRRVRLALPPL